MDSMFWDNARFNGDISGWNINDSCDTTGMFEECFIRLEYMPNCVWCEIE
jgi:hypothetical protein